MRSYAPILVLCSFAVCAAASFAEPAQSSSIPKLGVAITIPVITGPVDESQLVTLTGNTTPAALNARDDRGPVPDSMTFDHLLLALKAAPATEARLEKLIEEMHRQDSPNFHRWLTPQQLGERFGAAPQDREVIQHWLEGHGFSINRVYQKDSS